MTLDEVTDMIGISRVLSEDFNVLVRLPFLNTCLKIFLEGFTHTPELATLERS